jgi:heat shock transcription factor 1
MVSNPEIISIVSWSDCGNSFIIHSLPDFSEIILPKYFKHSNFPSFIRQLNMYDFHKIRSHDHGWMYSHPFFIQNRSDLLKKITRKTREKAEIVESLEKREEFSGALGKISKINKKQQKIELKLNNLNEKISDLQENSSKIIEELKDSNIGFNKILNVFEMFRRISQNQGNLFEGKDCEDEFFKSFDVSYSAEASTDSFLIDQSLSSPEDLFLNDS